MRWLALVVFPIAAAEPGYVDPATCRPCHSEIYASYMQTGMGRSFRAGPDVPPLTGFRHAASGESFSLIRRDGTTLLHREPYGVERPITHVIGSGNHSKTFLSRTSLGKLIELPLSWYSENGGTWQMSPGYDRPDHSGFRREVSDSCLFCHNGYPSETNGGLANGIDCQRCHGPGERHARERGPIVNPAKLSSERKFEVCLQCHLESASRTLPDAVRAPGRAVFSYRPGEPLSDYIRYYEFAAHSGDERITVNGAGYGLLQSACYLKSGGKLTCTTCHDPHKREVKDSCRTCHAGSHEPSRTNCTSCHMAKRRTQDAVHVVMTDHRIRRQPLPGDQLAPAAERHDRLTGPVRPLYPRQSADTAAARLAFAMAQRDTALLQRAIAESKPATGEPYAALGDALKAAGRLAEAIREYRLAYERDRTQTGALVSASELLLARRRTAEAIALLEPAARLAPNDGKLLNSLAILYVESSRFAEALGLMNRAVTIDPEDSATWLNLGVCREVNGDRAGAITAYRTSLALQPDLGRARQFLDRLSRP